MQIALRCEKCGNIFKQNEDDVCLEIDFKEKKITYICRNKECRHENCINLFDWKLKQKQSPLPAIKLL